MFVVMKMPVSLQPYLYQLQNFDSTASQADASTSDDVLFADILQAEVAAGQRVISAQEIEFRLDGTNQWSFLQGDSEYDTYTSYPTSAGKDHDIPVQTILEKISRMASSHGVDEDLIREVVRAESNFNPNAVSGAGAKGLMQLMDRTAQAMHVRNVYDPDENLAGGTKYLKSLLDRFDGNVGVALAAYNAGPTRVSNLGITNDEELREHYSQLPQETQRYVDKILNRL
ncbi:lytic transglycosylase domain-containing protein [Brevibacillus invocatus]